MKTEQTSHNVSAVFAIVLDDSKNILITFNKRGLDIPGGHVEEGETPIEALKREVKEEAGIDIKNIKLLGGIVTTSGKYKDKSMNFYIAEPEIKGKGVFMSVEAFMSKYNQDKRLLFFLGAASERKHL